MYPQATQEGRREGSCRGFTARTHTQASAPTSARCAQASLSRVVNWSVSVSYLKTIFKALTIFYFIFFRNVHWSYFEDRMTTSYQWYFNGRQTTQAAPILMSWSVTCSPHSNKACYLNPPSLPAHPRLCCCCLHLAAAAPVGFWKPTSYLASTCGLCFYVSLWGGVCKADH